MYIYTCIRRKHPWTSDTFEKILLLVFLSNTPLWVFSRHFIYFFSFILLYSFIIDNAKPTCLSFKSHAMFPITQSIIW